MKKNTYKGFSLPEMLMTLTIIGVIATITIPSLKKVADEHANVAKVQKAYATIANATKSVQTSEGGMRFWPWGNISSVMTLYKPKLNIMKDCKTAGGCFPNDYNLRQLSGADASESANWSAASSDWNTFITTDGAYWAVRSGSPQCKESLGEGKLSKNSCGIFYVDVNGSNEPNMVGIDVFGFSVSTDGTYPLGGCPSCSFSSCSSTGTGWACTAKILQEGKITW